MMNPLGLVAMIFIVLVLINIILIGALRYMSKVTASVGATVDAAGTKISGSIDLKASVGVYRSCYDSTTLDINGKKTSLPETATGLEGCTSASSKNIGLYLNDSSSGRSAWKATQALLPIAFVFLLSGLTIGLYGVHKSVKHLSIAGFGLAVVGAAALLSAIGTWAIVNKELKNSLRDPKSAIGAVLSFVAANGGTVKTDSKFDALFWVLIASAVFAMVGVGLGIPAALAGGASK